jgi:hypothetical protein
MNKCQFLQKSPGKPALKRNSPVPQAAKRSRGKIRSTKFEIRNKFKIQIFKIQNKSRPTEHTKNTEWGEMRNSPVKMINPPIAGRGKDFFYHNKRIWTPVLSISWANGFECPLRKAIYFLTFSKAFCHSFFNASFSGTSFYISFPDRNIFHFIFLL